MKRQFICLIIILCYSIHCIDAGFCNWLFNKICTCSDTDNIMILDENSVSIGEKHPGIIRGSKKLVTKTVELSPGDLKKLIVAHCGTCIIKEQKKPQLTITTNDNIAGRITVQANNGQLSLGLTPGTYQDITVNYILAIPKLPATIELSGAISLKIDHNDQQDFLDINQSGSSKIIIKNGVFSSLKAYMSGHSRIEAQSAQFHKADIQAFGSSEIQTGSIKNLKADISGSSSLYIHYNKKDQQDSLDIKASGSSTITIINGIFNALKAHISGCTRINAQSAQFEKVDAQASGSSKITIGLVKKLYAHASGCSSIQYKPAINAFIDKKTSGISTIDPW